jgi:hypothetical protein
MRLEKGCFDGSPDLQSIERWPGREEADMERIGAANQREEAPGRGHGGSGSVAETGLRRAGLDPPT